MIQKFENWKLNENTQPRVYGIADCKFKVYSKDDNSENDNTIEVQKRHPNMGMVGWFTLDGNGLFHTKTSATEEFVTKQLLDILEPSLPNNQAKYKADNKRMLLQFIDTYPVFKKWFDRAKRNVKFGL